MRTAGRWPPLMLTNPTPESWEIFCAKAVSAKSSTLESGRLSVARASVRIKRLHLNGGVIDLRQSRDRQLPVGDPAHQNDSHHEECGGNRPQNKRPRRAHRREPPDWRRGELGAGGALGFPGVALVDACAPPLFPLAIVGATLLPS